MLPVGDAIPVAGAPIQDQGCARDSPIQTVCLSITVDPKIEVHHPLSLAVGFPTPKQQDRF